MRRRIDLDRIEPQVDAQQVCDHARTFGGKMLVIDEHLGDDVIARRDPTRPAIARIGRPDQAGAIVQTADGQIGIAQLGREGIEALVPH